MLVGVRSRTHVGTDAKEPQAGAWPRGAAARVASVTKTRTMRHTAREPPGSPGLTGVLQNHRPARFGPVGAHRRTGAKRSRPVHAGEEHSASKRKEILTRVEDAVLRDMSPSQEDGRHAMPPVCGAWRSRGHGDRGRAAGTAGRRRPAVARRGRRCSRGRRPAGDRGDRGAAKRMCSMPRNPAANSGQTADLRVCVLCTLVETGFLRQRKAKGDMAGRTRACAIPGGRWAALGIRVRDVS